MSHKISIIGHVGQDAVKRFTPTGLPVSNFTVASNRRRQSKDENGKPVEVTTWFRCAAWNGLADVVAEHVTKGRLVHIEGVLAPEPRIWTDNSGKARCGYEVSIREFEFLDRKPEPAAGDMLNALVERDSDGQPVGIAADDDIPF